MLTLLTLAPATAQEPGDPKSADAPAIRTCVTEKTPAKGKPNPCVETIAKTCMIEVGNDYDGTQRDCYRRGAQAWDVILNEEYGRLREGLDSARFNVLRNQQRAWLKKKTAKCDGIYAQFQGTMAYPMMAFCENRETALRALVLMSHSTKKVR
ncbi:MAG: hypothetical protein JWN71_3510 [Xanthobacteraceae bacterium]|jgi:uncharacterized protein YecT (DUF1311 family)|nr:hypothetical protein [Xanthobacteraceae bacterium]